jgi:transglutaminase-like putative cysteine protease
MKYRIVHRTRYDYGLPVVLCHNEARLRPRATARQRRERFDVTIDPPPAQRAEREDMFGNGVLYFAVQEEHTSLVVTASSVVEVTAAPPRSPAASPAWEEAARRVAEEPDAELREARHFVLDSPAAFVSPEVAAFAAPSFPPCRPLFEAVHDLNARIHRELVFDPASTTVATPLAEVLAQRRGVCQDFAHLAVACLRSRGIPARYVSGYLETVSPPGAPRLEGADASHAWFAALVPGVGWCEFDPTNDQIPAEQHVVTAWGRDYTDVAPLKGVIFGGGSHTLEVAVDMSRIAEDGGAGGGSHLPPPAS